MTSWKIQPDRRRTETMKTDPILTANLAALLKGANIVILTPAAWTESSGGKREWYVLLISGAEEGSPLIDRFNIPADRDDEVEAYRNKVHAHLLADAPRIIIDTDDEREAVRVATTLWPNDQRMRRIAQEMDNDPVGFH
jgi:hypothetical protein